MTELEETSPRVKESERQRTAAEKLAAFGRWVTGLVHQVKNPLCVVLVGVETLRRTIAKGEGVLPRQKLLEEIGLIQEAAHKLNATMEELLQRFVILTPQQRQRVRPEELLQSALARLEPKILSGKITVKTNWPKDPLWIEADRNQLEQVFGDLLTNAVEAMPQGGTIGLSTAREGALGVVSVSDQGPGIPKEALPHLFEPLFTTKREVKRGGLGLAVSRAIVRNHGGTLEVQSQPGRGAVFQCRFPLCNLEKRREGKGGG